VDATYRADLRELNELNFQRFDAKVEQRFAQADAKLAALRDQIRTDLSDRHMSLLRWMFGFWIATLLAVLGLYVR
jgi:CRP-like cAMP-binding protein